MQTKEDDNKKVSLLLFYCDAQIAMIERMLNNAQQISC